MECKRKHLFITPVSQGGRNTISTGPSPTRLRATPLEKEHLIITSTSVRKALRGHPSKYTKQLTARFIDELSDYGSEFQRGLIKFSLKSCGRRTLKRVRTLKTLLTSRRRDSPGGPDHNNEQINKQS